MRLTYSLLLWQILLDRETVYLSRPSSRPRPRIWFPHLSTKTRSGTSVRKLAICLADKKRSDGRARPFLKTGTNVLGFRACGDLRLEA